MTTVNKTDSHLVDTLVALTPSINAWIKIGWREYRNTTGTDRTLQAGRTFIFRRVPYFTKPRFRTIVIPARKLTAEQKKVYRKLRIPFPSRKSERRKVEFERSKLRYRSVREDVVRAADVPHNYSGTRWVQNVLGGCFTYRNGAWDNWGLPNISIPNDDWTDADDLALIGKLHERIAGTDFNAGVAIAEAPRALMLIAETATKLYKAVKQCKRGNPEGAVRILTGTKPKSKLSPKTSAAADNWLALQYGWKPLVQDIYGAAVFLDNVYRRPPVYTFKVRRNATGRRKPLDSSLPFPQGIVRLPCKLESSKQIVAQLTSVDFAKLSGLQDPASVAWELVPFSFVADWVIPVGDYLQALNLARSIKGTYVTTKTRRLWTYGAKADSNYALHAIHDGSKISLKWTSVTRVVSSSLNIPSPKAKPFEKVASWGHAANAVALLVGAFGGKPRAH